MRLPTEIKGKNRLRDFTICLDYINGYTSAEIKVKRNFKITIRRIDQILYTCSNFLNPRVAWPKSKRIHKRQKLIDNSEQKTKKDIVDQLNDLTREIEGNSPLIDNSKHNHYTVEILTDDKSDRSPVALKTESGLGRLREE